MPAVDAAKARCCKRGLRWMTATISQVVTVPVDDGHHLTSCDSYISGRILRVFDHQAPCVIKSSSPWFFSARATKCALTLYTITIDRVYDSKA